MQALFAPAETASVPASVLVAQLSSSLARVEKMDGDDLALTAYARSTSGVDRASSADPKASK